MDVTLPVPMRGAFEHRATHAIERLARDASLESLEAAMAAASDAGALARILADMAVDDAARRIDPLVPAIARGAEIRAGLIEAAGGVLSATQVAAMLGITRAAVDKRRLARRLLALRIRGDWAYPAAQFQDAATPEGLSDVLAAMADASPWSVLETLLTPDDALGGATPIAALRAGRAAELRRLVAAQAQDSFG